jgi:hypothetical protein
MKKLLKTLFLLTLVVWLSAAIAAYLAKKKLESMTDDEIRAFLAGKLEGKVGEEQLASIQESVVTGIRKGRQSVSTEEGADSSDEPADEDEVESAEQESAEPESTEDGG